jgi:hypothetical protein
MSVIERIVLTNIMLHIQNVSPVPSTRSIYSFSKSVSIAYKLAVPGIPAKEQSSDLLYIGNLRGESLRNHLLNQKLVLHRLARLHDSDDDGLDHIFTVVVDSLEHLRALSLRLRLVRLVQVDADLLGFET